MFKLVKISTIIVKNSINFNNINSKFICFIQNVNLQEPNSI